MLCLKSTSEFLLGDALLGHFLFGVLVFKNVWTDGWMDDSLIPLLMDHVFWAFSLAFPTGHLASPSGAQATRLRAFKAEPFLSNPKLASLLQYSCVNDATRHATLEPSPTSPLDPPRALSGQGSLVLFQDALFICPLLFFYPGLGCYESSPKTYKIL